MCALFVLLLDYYKIYELLRQYISVRTITQHPEFNQVTTMIMMVLDYLNTALEVNPESKSASNQIVVISWDIQL